MEDGWSAIAAEWSELWGSSTTALLEAIVADTGVGPGTRVLDVGCGSGEMLALAASHGATVAGVDPAAGMVAIAARLAPAADVRVGGAEQLPWPDDTFDVVTAINALQFADDTDGALEELARVTTPGGMIAIANWAGSAMSDLDVIQMAIARADGEEPAPDGDLRAAGGLEQLVADAGLELVASRTVASPWVLPSTDALVRAVLLGEDADRMADRAAIVVEAAAPFRYGDGYRLQNSFRLAIARVP